MRCSVRYDGAQAEQGDLTEVGPGTPTSAEPAGSLCVDRGTLPRLSTWEQLSLLASVTVSPKTCVFHAGWVTRVFLKPPASFLPPPSLLGIRGLG